MEIPHSLFGWCPLCKVQLTQEDIEKLVALFGKVEAGTLCYQCTIREADKEAEKEFQP